MTTLRILTLNCWGVFIPGTVKYRRERIEAIGDEVAKQNYDLVIFCEVWLKSDYQRLCQRLHPVLPHSHYFYSGAIGSGVCIFSAHAITETLFHGYTMNGFAHKPYHGDWFGGKGVGLSKFTINGIKVNLYASHMHAEYSRDKDDYISHRVSQTFEMSQFIKLTSETCDVILVGGDLNFESVDLGYKLMRGNAGLRDCWLDKKRTSGYEHGNTDEVPDNSFSTPQPGYPDGKRIDYLLYRTNNNWNVSVEECSVTMNRIPGREYSYSDHEAVMAILRIDKGSAGERVAQEEEFTKEKDNILTKAVSELKQGQKKTEADQTYFQIQTFVLLILLYFLEVSGSAGMTAIVSMILSLVKLIVVLALIVCAWTGFIVKRIEVHGLKATTADVLNLLETSRNMHVN